MGKVKPSNYIVLILACLVAFGPLSIDMYLPALPAISDSLSASAGSVKQTITIFLVGFSIGMLIYGPLSDRYGRRKLLISGIIIYLLATVGAIFAPNVEVLLGSRLLQALGGASASVLARAIVRDLYELKDAAKILSWMQIITMIATLIAPILGSVLMAYLGWQSIFVFLFLFALLCFFMYSINISETLEEEWRLPSIKHVFQSYFKIATSAQGLAYILCMSSAFAGMFVYITASPFVFIEHFGLSAQQYAYLFAANIFGIMIMTFINASFVSRVGPQNMIQFSATILCLASIALLVFGITNGGMWSIMLGIWFFVAMTGSLNANCIASLMGIFSKQAGAAAGLAIASQFGLGALMSWLVSQFTAVEAWPMTTLMGAMGVLCFICMLCTRIIRRKQYEGSRYDNS